MTFIRACTHYSKKLLLNLNEPRRANAELKERLRVLEIHFGVLKQRVAILEAPGIQREAERRAAEESAAIAGVAYRRGS